MVSISMQVINKFILPTLFLLLAFASQTTAQIIDQHEFVGTIKLEDQSIIAYKLLFDEYEDGSIKGRSITDFAGSHRTESIIEGSLSDNRQKISFQEIRNVSTKSNMKPEDFCYVKMENAKVKLKKKKASIKGGFTSAYSNGEPCINGEIMLIGEDAFEKKIRKVTRKVKRFAPRSKKQKTLDILDAGRSSLEETLILKDDEILTLEAFTDSISLQVWDDQFIDGDQISIYVNDSLYTHGFKVEKEIEVIHITLPTDTTEITIVADNEGKYPPNSSNISLVHDDATIPVSVRLLKGKQATFRFVKQLYVEEAD